MSQQQTEVKMKKCKTETLRIQIRQTIKICFYKPQRKVVVDKILNRIKNDHRISEVYQHSNSIDSYDLEHHKVYDTTIDLMVENTNLSAAKNIIRKIVNGIIK
jgi:hypothetical protein